MLPLRIAHAEDSRGDHFVVQYLEAQLCADGRRRKTMWYQCCPRSASQGSVVHREGHRKAEEFVWAHVDQVLSRGTDALLVDGRFGGGELRGEGRFRRHGDPHEDFCFYVHPRRMDFSKSGGAAIWRPGRDTLVSADEFCTAHVFVRQLAHGVKVFQCLGHDVPTGEDCVTDWPPSFNGAPLAGLTLAEVFSGREDEGGCMLSAASDAAGGFVVRYYSRRDERQDFMADDAFWADHLKRPRSAYHFAYPCHHMSVARTTPWMVRIPEFPMGVPKDPLTTYYNKMAQLMVDRIWKSAAGGARILI